jgi:hypothetical protein
MAQIERLARAKKVEWKVCNDEYTATDEELQDLRTFLIKMKDPSSVLSAPKAIEPRDAGGSLGKSSLPNSMTIEEKLQELDRRYRNALLLPEEYQRQRAELLEQQRNPDIQKLQRGESLTRSTETAPPQAASVVSVTTIELGNQIGADKRVTRPMTSFAPKDTLYATVVTTGSAPSTTLTAKWTYQDGQLVNENTQTIAPTGPAATEFHIAKPDGWPAGIYKVEVFLNGRSTGTKEFEVKRY